MTYYYNNGMEIKKGDMLENLMVPSFIRAAYLEDVNSTNDQLTVRTLISTKGKYVNSNNHDVVKVKGGLKFEKLRLLMRREEWTPILETLLDNPFPEYIKIKEKWIEKWKE